MPEPIEALAHLTLQDLLDAAGPRNPTDVAIKVEELSGQGVWAAGAVTVDVGGALVVRP